MYNFNTILRLSIYFSTDTQHLPGIFTEHQVKALLICLETYMDYLSFLESGNTDNPLKEDNNYSRLIITWNEYPLITFFIMRINT